MTSTRLLKLFAGFVLAATLVCAGPVVQGQLTATAPNTPVTSPSSGGIASADEFQIPANADAEELLLYARRLMTDNDKSFDTEEEFKDWLRKMFQAVLTAADRVIAMEPENQFYLAACGMKGQVLAYQSTADTDVRKTFDDFIKWLESNKRVQDDEKGKIMTLALKGVAYQDKVAAVIRNGAKLDDFMNVMKEIQSFITQNPDMADMVYDLIYPITIMAEMNDKPELPGEILGRFYNILKDSASPEHQAAAKGLEGPLRFAALKGQEMPIAGTLIDDKPFDPATIKGKVVLVNFWATWCAPCRMIYPEVLALYQKYQSRGFEVVGYSIDSDVNQLRKYVAENKIPWSILSEEISVENKHPSLREYYGISGVPTLILIGKDGKVITQHADIDAIKNLLAEQFP